MFPPWLVQGIFIENIITNILNELINNESSNVQHNTQVPITPNTYNKFREIKFEEISPNINKNCNICLDNFESADIVTILPCEHFFHVKCIKDWLLKYNHTCPNCRKSCDN